MKRHILLVIATCLASLVMASNTLSFASVNGTPQTEVEVAVNLDNTDAIVALEMILPLGEHLKYVDNSAVLAEARSNGHQISAGQVGQELRVYIYSLSLNALQGNTGELMTFRLQLGNEPIDFTLSPTLVLSNAQGKSVSSSVHTGNVTIQAPKLEILNPQIDFGHIPIRDTYTQDLLLKNVGTLPLSIENITTSNPLLIPLQTAMTIEANQTASVAIQYEPIEHGPINEKITVRSNAPNGIQEVTVIAAPFSVNELHIGNTSGIANEEVTISLSMNNMAPIVAVQCSIALPEQLEYVPNSIVVNSSRSNGHQALATIKKYVPKTDQWDEFTGDTLVLMLFSMTNQVFNANDGEIANFKLRLNGNSGSYTLRPHDVALLTATAENMLSAAYEATVDVQSPSFNGDDYLSFGDWAITDDVVANYVIRNYGDAPLEIERVTFLSQGYRVVSPMPLQINPWEESTMQIAYAPSSEGDFTTTMNIYTNDPTNSLKAVLISGHVYEPNSLTVDGARTPEGNYQLAISLSNYTDIVALQYDIHWRSDMTTSQSAFAPTTRLQNHNATVVKMDEDTYRVIIYSMANTPIIGNEGELHHLTFTPQGDVDYCGDVLTIDNIVLSNANGTDKVSQSTVLHHLPTTQYSEQAITACDQYAYNNKVYQSSGTYIDTLQTVGGCDSIVTTYLTINRSEREEYYETACDEYYWDHNGETYYESGDYEYYTTTDQGCERVEVLHLTINRSEREEYNVAACEEYWWHDNQYTESGDYEYRTTIESTTEKLYVGYDFQNEAIIGLTPPRGVSRFTVDGYITDGSGWCFVGTGSPENGNVDDGGDLRIFEYEETLHYDRVWGRQGHFYGDHRNPFNIEFGNYYAKNIETGEYYFIDEENVHEYSNTEYPLTLFYGDYGKIHKVQFFDNNNSLWADINAVIEGGVPMIKIDYYNPNGTIYHTQQFTENLQAETRTITEQGCERVEVLRLTINKTQYAEETVTACDSYTWNGEIYTESGEYTYTTTAANGCDSVVTLHLTINATKYAEETVTACDGYVWNGETYTESGDYTYTTTAANGCDSIVTLHLAINATKYTEETVIACDSYTWNGETYTESGEYTYTTTAANGCDSIVTLYLTINQTQYAEETVTACDNYTWNGETYTESGDYTYTTTAANGCDSIVTLYLTINNSEIGAIEYATICYGETYIWNGQTYAATGEYSVTLTNAAGCDSIATLHLTIMPEAVTSTETVVIGSDELPYTWRGNTYLATGRYTDIEQYTQVDCDSAIHVLDLIVLTTGNFDEESITICETETPYMWYGESYTATGKYTYTEKYTGTDIDSVQHILNLTVNPTKSTEETVIACDSYTWNGETYTESGEYTYNTTATNGCDSIVTLHLTINRTQYAEETVTACDNYTWNGETYTASGEYTYTTTAANGCDSIVTLHLTINATKYTEETVTACDSYVWNGETYTTSGEYTYTTTAANGCDSIVTLHLTINKTQYAEEIVTACDSYTWNGETYTESGEYVYTTTANGCDSIVTLHLTINKTQYAEESVIACDSYTWNGETYTESGKYTYNTVAANGCDSVITLHLTINATKYAEETVIACDSYTWNGETYTESGEYSYTTTAANGCDSVVTLHLTINRSEREEYYETACDEYWWDRNGETYYESGDYTYNTTTADGCERIEVLHLTILPDATAESETLALCPSELPYEWYGQWLTEAGTYSATEQYVGMECDSIIHELTLNVYVQTLPATVTLPIVRTGEAIDVTIPTAEIQAHIAAETWYAPNAEVAWYIMDNSDWAALSAEPVAAGITEVTLKYAVETDCGNIEYDKMVINLKATDMENTHIQSPISNCQKILYEDHIYILREGKVYSVMGHEL